MRCSLNARLREFLDGLPRERVGLILDDDSLVELANVSAEPENSFLVLADDLLPYLRRIRGTFHTHPMGGLDPTADDILGFQQWPDLEHWIVAPEGAQRFRVEHGAVIRA